MKKYFIFILYFILFSCSETKYPIDGEELSGGYICRVEGEAVILSNNMLKPSIFGAIKTYAFDERFIIIRQEPNRNSYLLWLPEVIMTYASLTNEDLEDESDQSNFLIDFRKENEALYNSKISPNHNLEDIQLSKAHADSLISFDSYYQKIFSQEINYWIISHREVEMNSLKVTSDIYGPFSKESYIKKRNELAVPKELKLRE